MPDKNEIQEKEARVRRFMAEEEFDALALTTVHNFAWFTCGGSNYVAIGTEIGAATILIAKTSKYIITDNIEAGRIANEEVAGQGFEIIAYPWHENKRDDIIRDLAAGGRIGSDIPIEGTENAASLIDPLRYSLTAEEIERYRSLGKTAGECIEQTCREIEPGLTEIEIAAILNSKLASNGIIPNVTLIAADERISQYRHPLPTNKKLSKYAMLVTGARKWGLVASVTRLVHFGELSQELRAKHDAVAKVDAAFISATRIGACVGDIFNKALSVYAETGYENEWQLHHQGGATGYRGRDYKANAETKFVVQENQAFAWNPSITGTKTEDTIIATKAGTEIISRTGNWPEINIEINGTIIKRPDILVR